MAKHRIVVATNGMNGLEDVVSNVFGRARTFTIVDVEDEKILNVSIIKNPALSYAHGAGPIAVKTLVDEGVEVVVAYETGVGASELLWQHNVLHVPAKPGSSVEKVIKETLQSMKKENLQ